MMMSVAALSSLAVALAAPLAAAALRRGSSSNLLHRKLQGATNLVITGVIDGPRTGGTPKAVELYACGDIVDLGEYCLTSPNNANPTPSTCTEFNFPSGPVPAGTYLYVASETAEFANFFGFQPDYTGGVANVNGDDAVVLFRGGNVVVDRFGEDADGTGQSWEYLDGWAYRNADAPASASFVLGDWTYSGKNALDGESTNGAAAVPFPAGTFASASCGGGGPGPSTTTTTTATPAPPGTVTKISAVQGSTATSPQLNNEVTVEAVVVGDFQDGDADAKRNLGGFYLQEEDADADADPSTSEGIFVYEGASLITDVSVGDLVRVTGTVSESFGQTQITPTSVSVIGTAALLPTPATITFPVNAILIGGDYEPDLEAYEGMRVKVSNQMSIIEMFNLDRYNEIKMYAAAAGRPYQYTQLNTPDAAGYAAHLQTLASNRITYDDGLSTQNEDIALLDGFGPVYNTATAPRMGDTVDGLEGILTIAFDNWRIRSAVDGTNVFAPTNPRPPVPPAVGGNVKMASFNVLNFFTTIDLPGAGAGPSELDPRGADTQDEFDRQRDKLVTAIAALDADLLGLVELENDFDGPNSALNTLVDEVNSRVGAGTYSAVYPGQQYVDSSDAISVGFMYKPSVLTLTGSPAILTDSNLPPGSSSPIFDGTSTNRASLAVTFTVVGGGECITVACNHFKSKGGTGSGSGNQDIGDGAGSWNQRRLDAAVAVADWLKLEPTGSVCPNKAIVGDLNAYAQEDPVRFLIDAAGYSNVEADTDYSYVFDGQIGTLDYILLNSALDAKKVGSGVWHICEDEADALDYNLDFGRSASYFDGMSPARPSDHSPVIVGLDMSGPATTAAPPQTTTITPPTPPQSGSNLLITGVIDGPRRHRPRAVELYACGDVPDLGEYCLESPNNGASTPSSCGEFNFPAGPMPAGTYLYVSRETDEFNAFFGFEPDYADRVADITGDDAVVLFRNDVVVDMFGEEATDGSGRPWEYTDGWAYRKDDTAAASSFDANDWDFSGRDALDGEVTNAGAATPFPAKSFTATACA